MAFTASFTPATSNPSAVILNHEALDAMVQAAADQAAQAAGVEFRSLGAPADQGKASGGPGRWLKLVDVDTRLADRSRRDAIEPIEGRVSIELHCVGNTEAEAAAIATAVVGALERAVVSASDDLDERTHSLEFQGSQRRKSRWEEYTHLQVWAVRVECVLRVGRT